jgi:hypothetical protein
VPFDVVPGTGPGVVEVRLRVALGSDTAGLDESVDPAGPTAEIRLR